MQESGNLSNEKKLSGRYGSLASIKKNMEDLQKRKEALIKSMADEGEMKALAQKAQKGEQLTDKESEDLRSYLIAKDMVERAETRLKDLNKAAKKLEARKNQVEGEENTSETSLVLDAEEIMALSPSDRAFMLNPANRNKYSAAQQKVIDELNQKGQWKYGKDWQKKLQDRARLEAAREQNLKTQNQLMESADKLAQYVHGARMNKAIDSKIKQLETVFERADENEDSYSRFVDLMTEDNGDDIVTKMAKDRLMKKYGQSNAVRKYQSRKAQNDKTWQAFIKSNEYKEMTSDQKEMAQHVFIEALNSDIDMTDADAIENLFQETSISWGRINDQGEVENLTAHDGTTQALNVRRRIAQSREKKGNRTETAAELSDIVFAITQALIKKKQQDKKAIEINRSPSETAEEAEARVNREKYRKKWSKVHVGEKVNVLTEGGPLRGRIEGFSDKVPKDGHEMFFAEDTPAKYAVVVFDNGGRKYIDNPEDITPTEEQKKDDEAWEKAKKEDTESAYRQYLNAIEHGSHSKEAQDRI